MKDKAFARNVSRDDLVQGAEELGVELDDLIEFVADALKPVASELGSGGRGVLVLFAKGPEVLKLLPSLFRSNCAKACNRFKVIRGSST